MIKPMWKTCGALVVAAGLVPLSFARPFDAVGACTKASQLERATGTFAGTAAQALLDPKFATEHGTHTEDFGARWLSKLDGASGLNRIYVQGPMRILVLTVCGPGNCDRQRAYVAYDPMASRWGASLYLDGQTQELGEPIMPGSALQAVPKELTAALICAQNLDWGAK